MKGFKRLNKEDRAGLYLTIIVHLVVLIIFLATQLGFSLQKENSFVLDFTKQEELEKQQQEELFKDDISKRIEEMLAASEAGSIPVRNVAVDRSSLKDDRGTDAEELYKEAERLANELKNGFEVNREDEVPVAEQPSKEKNSKPEESAYKGPSVVSYELDGRKASKLSIPAYRCIGAGMVTVIITVDNAGNVIAAKVQEEASSTDQCLRNFAVRAARLSKFSSSPTAPPRQGGNIVYQFIAQ